jgi:hypothetical protein
MSSIQNITRSELQSSLQPGHLPILALRESLNDMSGADQAYQLWAKKVDFRVKSF